MKTVRSGGELTAALQAAGKRTGKDYGFVIQKLALDAFRELIIRSARDTGFLRSNWSMTIGRPPEDKLRGTHKGSYQDATLPGTKVEVGDRVLIYNNTEYAMFLETGTPKMRAQPMVAPTYQHTISVANSLVRALSKERYRNV